MSGGIAYVLDLDGTFPPLVNKEMVELETLSEASDQDTVLSLVRKHAIYTGSSRARWVLDNWQEMVGKFVKVMPADYKLALKKLEEESQEMREGDRLEVAHG
jgi:glutamate synthase domain-containing protein 3